MKSSLLLPRYFKVIGIVLAIPGFILGGLFQISHYVIPFLNYNGGGRHGIFTATGQNNFTDELATTLLIAGLAFIGFSKFKNENYQNGALRLKALYWAVLVNSFLIMLLLIIFLSGLFRSPIFPGYDTAISDAVINNNLLFLLVIFIARLYYLCAKENQQATIYYLPYMPFNLAGKVLTCGFVIGVLILVTLTPGNIKVPDSALYLIFPFTLMWIASKEKKENETMESIRLKAMQISVYIVYGLLLLLTWLLYGINYWIVLTFGLVAVQLVFIVTFWIMHFKAPKPSFHVRT